MTAPTPTELDHALQHGLSALWATQYRSGRLPSENHGGPIYTGLYLATLGWLGALSTHDAREGTRWLLSQQRQDGSFSADPTRYASSVTATWCAVVGLEAAGQASGSAAARQARAWIDGAPAGPFVAPLLALHDPSHLRRVPMAWAASPRLRDFAWRWLHPWMTLSAILTSAISHGLRHPPAPETTRRGRQQAAVVATIGAHQNPCGSWVGSLLFTLLGVAALRLLGVPDSDPRIAHALRWIQMWRLPGPEGLEVMPFSADTWNTARGLRATVLAGPPSGSDAHTRAAQWLVHNQVRTPGPPGWQNNAQGYPDTGGWAYESTSVTGPDCDTTGAVVGALALHHRLTGDSAARDAAEGGRDWLLGMQNPDGGFPAFRRGLGERTPGPMFTEPIGAPTTALRAARMLLRPPQELLDPSTEGVTGRILVGLRDIGTPVSVLAQGGAFIERVQWQGKRWFGRWDCNYQAGTAYAISGLIAAGVGPTSEVILRASAWLQSKQNADGGFGENIDTYRVANIDAGPFESRADLTGTVLTALVDAGLGRHDAAHRAARFLVDTQQPSGQWLGPVPLYVVLPPEEFYSNPVASFAAPIEGLARYRDGNTP